MIGTRGVPAHYGGFETAVEEIGARLAADGHTVTVYSRCDGDAHGAVHRGMRRVELPALRRRSLETLSHTLLSVLHLLTRRRAPDVVLVFNAANAVLLPLLRLRRIPVATHVDGLEWKRDKWSGTGKRFYRTAEALAVRWSDALIADAAGIADYYREEFGAATEQIAYGAPIQRRAAHDRVEDLGLVPGGYHLVVARFEPENHVDLMLRGHLASRAALPVVVVGSAPYAGEHVALIESLAADERVHLLGPVWDTEILDQLYAHALTYLHGHSVGGTNPSLLRAMGAGTAVIAYDVVFNREVLGAHGCFVAGAQDVGPLLEDAEHDPATWRERGAALREHAARTYSWDAVAQDYGVLVRSLAQGGSQRGEHSGARASGGEIGAVVAMQTRVAALSRPLVARAGRGDAAPHQRCPDDGARFDDAGHDDAEDLARPATVAS